VKKPELALEATSRSEVHLWVYLSYLRVLVNLVLWRGAGIVMENLLIILLEVSHVFVRIKCVVFELKYSMNAIEVKLTRLSCLLGCVPTMSFYFMMVSLKWSFSAWL
jgi:hypothetical protein